MGLVLLAGFVGTFCFGALSGIAAACIFCRDQIENKATELYLDMQEWMDSHPDE